ncbi:MAG: hypothetical protein IPK58_24335 [Acidobacteria bacterium]|nr:hypothetical protein [Acidobacteriota bacterium]
MAKELTVKIDTEIKVGRALICSVFKNQLLSISMRIPKPPVASTQPARVDVSDWSTTFTASSDRGDFLNSLQELTNVLADEIFVDDAALRSELSGLLVITGATASQRVRLRAD